MLREFLPILQRKIITATRRLKLSVQFSSVYLIPFKQLHDKIQTQIRT